MSGPGRLVERLSELVLQRCRAKTGVTDFGQASLTGDGRAEFRMFAETLNAVASEVFPDARVAASKVSPRVIGLIIDQHGVTSRTLFRFKSQVVAWGRSVVLCAAPTSSRRLLDVMSGIVVEKLVVNA